MLLPRDGTHDFCSEPIDCNESHGSTHVHKGAMKHKPTMFPEALMTTYDTTMEPSHGRDLGEAVRLS